MKWHVARAMQIACLDGFEIEALHAGEMARGYCLPNWNIQEMFKKGALSDRFGIPDQDAGRTKHAARIDSEIHRVLKLKHYPCEVEVEAVHDFDKRIVTHRDQIVWESVGRGGKRITELETVL